MKPTYDDASMALRLLLTEIFPTLTGVIVSSRGIWRGKIEGNEEFFLHEVWFGSFGFGVCLWFDLDDISRLVEAIRKGSIAHLPHENLRRRKMHEVD